MTHTCPACFKNFTRLSNLRRHVETIHERNFEHLCTICRTTFTRRDDAAKHYRRKHPKVKPLILKIDLRKRIETDNRHQRIATPSPSWVSMFLPSLPSLPPSDTDPRQDIVSERISPPTADDPILALSFEEWMERGLLNTNSFDHLQN